MTLRSLNRWQAFGIHLAISAVIATTVVLLVLLVWYPQPYFFGMGGEVLLRLLIGVDVVLGPVITLIIFDPAKPRLKYDLAAIAVLQLAALAYGSYVMFDARPVYNVFVKDRFETVPANGLVEDSLARAAPEYRDLPLAGPRVVAAQAPKDADEQLRVAMGQASGNGPDLSELPHLYTSYAQAAPQAAQAARSLVMLAQKGRESAEAVNEFVTEHGNGARNLGYLPVRARNRDFAAVVDRKTGEIVGYLELSPW